MTDDQLLAAGWKVRPFDGFIGSLGTIWSRRDDDRFAYALRTEPRHANALGVVHGGLLSTLADHTMLVNTWQARGRKACLTVSLDVKFVASANPGELLVARARLDAQGNVLTFASATVSAMREDGSDAVVAMAAAVVRVR